MFDLKTKNSLIIISYMLSYFIAIGAFMPLFSLYLKELHFTGTQIGFTASISPFVMLLVQPIWGYVADYTQRFHFLLILTTIVGSITSLAFLFIGNSFLTVVALTTVLAIFLSAVEPISTSMIMSYTTKQRLTYADFRLWGAVGFAFSVWGLSQITLYGSLQIIFFVLSVFLFLSAIFALQLPLYEIQSKRKISKEEIKKLITHRPFLLFLFACFFVYGAMLANNSFFGLLYISLGGSIAGVGISFLISVGSEVPFMRLAGKLLKSLDITTILIIASIISAVQYMCFFYHPPEIMIYVLNIAQGFSLGIFIPVSIVYVQQHTPKLLQTTAIGIFNGVSFGLGNWFFTLIGGFVLDKTNIHFVYLLFSLVSFCGTTIFIHLQMTERRQKPFPFS